MFSQVIMVFNKGFLYTILKLLSRPGHSVREYIQGRRVQMVDFIGLLFFVLIIGAILKEIFPTELTIEDIIPDNNTSKDLVRQLIDFVRGNQKLFYIIWVPFFALSTTLFFRKKSKQNYAENLVLNFYNITAGIFIMIVVTNLLKIISPNDLEILKFVTKKSFFIFFAYSTWFYYQYFSFFGYKKLNLFIRSILTYIVGYVSFVIFILIIMFLKIAIFN